MHRKPILLHICKDYPDAVHKANKTKAVYNLVQNASEFDHIVFSLNRTSRAIKNSVIKDGSVYAITYWGLPAGVGLKFGLERAAETIEKIIEKEKLAFDMVHAHKLTMEGIVGRHISKRFEKPLVCTVRGLTDMEILRYKPLYKQFFADILRESQWLFFLAPWTQQAISALYPGIAENKSSMLPNIVYDVQKGRKPASELSNRFITAVRFDAKNYKSKHLDTTISAFDMACRKIGDIHLDIAGGGNSPNYDKVVRLIESMPSSAQIHLIGDLDNAEFCEILPDYAAFIRPSFPETFGMVFLEALFAGLPVLYAKGTGIDGYFPDAEFAVAVDHRSVEEIAEGVVRLYQNQKELKSRLKKWLNAGSLEFFMKENIVDSYVAHIHRLLSEN